MHDDVCTAVSLLHFFHGEDWASVAAPLYGRSVFLIALGDDVHLLAYHIAAVEAKAEVSDDGVGIVLVLVEEVVCTTEGNLVDVLFYLVGCHTDTAVAHGNGLCFLVHTHGYFQLAQLALEIAFSCQGLQLLGGIHCIAYNLTDEDFVVAVEKLFDDGENILCCNPNVSLFHRWLSFIWFFYSFVTFISIFSPSATAISLAPAATSVLMSTSHSTSSNKSCMARLMGRAPYCMS